jgi:hypothetical protein
LLIDDSLIESGPSEQEQNHQSTINSQQRIPDHQSKISNSN